MEQTEKLKLLPPLLLVWYDRNKRDLPWRRTSDPYRIWVSEIMLQQTRVEAVLPRYEQFLQAASSISALAEMPEQQLLKLWEGLGYYSRARNLQKAAQEIVAHHGGIFPREVSEIRGLPGIGDYTAGAIASIAFGAPEPAVDGNVLRVIARLIPLMEDVTKPRTKRMVHSLLKQSYPTERSGDYTQALMELGAVVCLPNGKPHCEVCPISHLCSCCAEESWPSLPIRAATKARRTEHKTVLLLRCGKRIALQRRPQEGLLAGLWQLPCLDGDRSEEAVTSWLKQQGASVISCRCLPPKSHIFTHIVWRMSGFEIALAELLDQFTWVTEDQLRQQFPLPTAFRQFLG